MAGVNPEVLGASTVPVQRAQALALCGAPGGPVLELYPFQGAYRFTGAVRQWLAEECSKMSPRSFRGCGVGGATGVQKGSLGPKESKTSSP